MPLEKNFLGDLPTWVTAIATLLLAALALFQDFLRRLVWKPKLELDVHPRPPDFHRTEWTYSVLQRVHDTRTNKDLERTVQLSSPCYYFRVRVTNKGNCEAKDVEIYAKDLQELVRGEFRSVPRFSPMDLLWADVGSGSVLFAPTLHYEALGATLPAGLKTNIEIPVKVMEKI